MTAQVSADPHAPAATVVLGRGSLTCAEVAALAHQPDVSVELAPEARTRVAASLRAAEELVGRRTVYGRNTGVGANKDVLVDDAEHPYRLLASHATSAGADRSHVRVRATAAVRANQLAVGHAGVSPAMLDGLLLMLAEDAFPPVREGGAVGTGDLGALAALAEYAAGRRPAADGRWVARPVPVTVHDALPMLSSSAATLADAALAVHDLCLLAAAATALSAVSATALAASPENVGPLARRAAPAAEVRQVMATVARLRAGGRVEPRHPQDPFSVRCAPQVLGAALRRLARVRQTVESHLNAGVENPLVVATGDQVAAAHHGGFYSLDVALDLDAALLGLVAVAEQSLGRVGALLDPASTGLPAFLSDGSPGASGAMLLEYAAAGALAELRSLAAPVTLHSVSLSLGTEESAPFTPLAARQALAAVPLLRTVLGCELVAAVRALRLGGGRPGPGVEAILAACVELDPATGDRDLGPDLETAERLLPVLAGFAACHSRVPAWKGEPVSAGRAEQFDEQLLRALEGEVIRMTGRRTTTYAGSLLENSAFRILRFLEESGPSTQRELSDALQLELSTVNRQVNAALRHGHVERFEVAGRSSRLVRPTVEGRLAFRHDGHLRAALYAQALDHLGPDRAGAMVESLREFNDALDRALTRQPADDG